MTANDIRDPDPLAHEEWAVVLEALEEVIDLKGTARVDELRRVLHAREALLPYALSILAEEEAENAAEENPRLPFRRIGPYELIEQVGSGGMGAVYRASRVDGTMERTVAIKLIHPGLGTLEVIARFERERQLQANLSHPSIATLLDGGETESGLPYIVLEYVDGQAIDEWCDGRRLTVMERLQLFSQVLRAVSHAHEQHVVHRDIKPSNVLVTDAGVPKLLDFGIAKLVDTEEEQTLTLEGMQRMTPAYASPEQLEGKRVTGATDIYSLGVLLFRLLTGQLPHDLRGCSPAQIEQIVTQEAPQRPSRALQTQTNEGTSIGAVCERRNTTLRTLERQLRGDLERIILTCLRKEPERRYASIGALLEDVQRFVTGRPILARPDTVAYRTLRFVQRNRFSVAATAFVVLALSSALFVSLVESRRATRATDRAEREAKLANERLESLRAFRRAQLEKIPPLLAEVPGTLLAREKLLEINLGLLEQETAFAINDADVLAEVVRSHILVADLAGDPLRSSRGASRRAGEVLDRARALVEQMRREYPDNPQTEELVGKWLVRRGALTSSEGDRDGARSLLLSARQYAETRLALPARASDKRLLYLVSDVERHLSYNDVSDGYFARAEVHATRSIEAMNRLIDVHPDTAFFVNGDIASTRHLLGLCTQKTGNHEQAAKVFEEAAANFDRVVGNHVVNASLVHRRAIFGRSEAAALNSLGRFDEAEEKLSEIHSALETLVEAAPDELRNQHWLANHQTTQATFFVEQARWTEADKLLETARSAVESLDRQVPDQRRYKVSLASIRLQQGAVDLGEGRAQDAVMTQRAVCASLETLLADQPTDYQLLDLLTSAQFSLGRALLAESADLPPSQRSDARTEAFRAMDRAREIAQDLVQSERGGEPLKEALLEIEEALKDK